MSAILSIVNCSSGVVAEGSEEMRVESGTEKMDEKELREAVKAADLIALATILEVGPPPAGGWTWSSFAPAYQTVRLRLDEVWKGRLRTGTEVEAHYMLLNGSNLAESNEPKLKASIFAIGSQRIVLLTDIEGERWEEYHDESYTVLPLIQQRAVRQALHLEK